MSNNSEADARTAGRRSVEVEITSKRWGSDSSSSIKVIEVPMIGENTVRLDITIDLRKTDTIEIRPVRRSMDDTEGLITDAERLANS